MGVWARGVCGRVGVGGDLGGKGWTARHFRSMCRVAPRTTLPNPPGPQFHAASCEHSMTHPLMMGPLPCACWSIWTGLSPQAVVIVTTVRALKMHGGGPAVKSGVPVRAFLAHHHLCWGWGWDGGWGKGYGYG